MLKFIAIPGLAGGREGGGAGLNSIYRKIEEITLIENVCRPAGLESFYFSNITRPWSYNKNENRRLPETKFILLMKKSLYCKEVVKCLWEICRNSYLSAAFITSLMSFYFQPPDLPLVVLAGLAWLGLSSCYDGAGSGQWLSQTGPDLGWPDTSQEECNLSLSSPPQYWVSPRHWDTECTWNVCRDRILVTMLTFIFPPRRQAEQPQFNFPPNSSSLKTDFYFVWNVECWHRQTGVTQCCYRFMVRLEVIMDTCFVIEKLPSLSRHCSS